MREDERAEYHKTFNRLSFPMKMALLTVYKKPDFCTQWLSHFKHVNDNSVKALKKRGLMVKAKMPTPFNDRRYYYVDQLTVLGALVCLSVNERDEM